MEFNYQSFQNFVVNYYHVSLWIITSLLQRAFESKTEISQEPEGMKRSNKVYWEQHFIMLPMSINLYVGRIGKSREHQKVIACA